MRQLVHVDPLKLAAWFGALITILGIAGAMEVRHQAAPAFDLDAELNLPAFAAAALLGCAAVAARVASAWDTARSWPWLVLAGLFSLMAADEALAIHESLEDFTAVDWQTLYVPVMLAGGAAWLAVLARLRRLPGAAALIAAGGALWACAGVLEAIQWTGPRETERAVAGYGILMGIEELMEMCGSACFALGPLVAARAWAGVVRRASAAASLASGARR